MAIRNLYPQLVFAIVERSLQHTVWLLGVALLAASCAPQGAITTSSTTTFPSTTTTTEATTTTTLPVSDTVPLTDPQDRDLLFDLTGIDSGSVAGYAGAGTNHEQVTTFPAGAIALESTGRVDESIDGTIWREIHTSLGRTAWVDASFLTPNTSAVVPFDEHRCSSFGTPEGELARSAPGESSADHVAQIWQVARPECTRVVIALGKNHTFDGSSPLAGSVPSDVAVTAFGTWVQVSLPSINTSRSDGGEDVGDLTAIVARTVEGQLVVDVHTGGPAEFFAQFLSNPARIVIDILPANVSATITTGAVIGEGVILAQPAPPAIPTPVAITGYSRWFEATGTVVVRRAAAEQGTGEVINARVEGEFVINPGRSTSWGITATDWLDAWGVFSFELSGVGAGNYEVFIGECRIVDGTADCEDVGVYLPVTISG